MYFKVKFLADANLANMVIHIDDIGATDSISLQQIALIESKQVDSFSVLMNGQGIDLFVSMFKERKLHELNLSALVHLNIMEGNPLTACKRDGILTKQGVFSLTHPQIFRILYLSGHKKRSQFLEIVESEWSAQITLALEVFGRNLIKGLDSHRHTHAYRQLNLIARKLVEAHHLKYIRPTYEKSFVASKRDLLRATYFIGVARNFYLKMVSPHRLDKLSQFGSISGIIYSGAMNTNSAIKGFKRNQRINTGECFPEKVLTIFHPGQAFQREVSEKSKTFQNWYLSKERITELDTVIEISKLRDLSQITNQNES
jgi:predicted glycoside hydrolase/deacetylase ChbG (UPF0249 family)